MRDAIRVRHSARPLPVELKLLLAGGFVLAGWLLTTVLGAPPAAADEAPSEPDTVAAQQQPNLLGAVTGLVGEVTGTVGTTLSAVTETAETTLTTVTETADQATHPIVEIVGQTVQTVAPDAPSEPVEPEPVAKTEAEPVITQPAAAAPKSAPPAPAEPTPAEPMHAVAHHAPAVKHADAPAPPRHLDLPVPVRADNGPPSPAPTDPGDPGVVITVSHDSGNGGRDLMAVLGPRTAAEPVQPIVGALTSGFVGMGTEAGLPPTSPD
ncbi:hypothetical protein L1857_04565 [Amycolatopsis thermalba]|uniref:Uncharacterized protein n=1 Tax=Amycolatopsis thermalba TaxID=944492 RepID=A0ABY4NQR8_9PSEU|nr:MULTISPECIES: hypothetical protein [Amycolatopsis]UQS22144.1 hypothetical protein L1857_04565 [Amycolatopsis thermalba]